MTCDGLAFLPGGSRNTGHFIKLMMMGHLARIQTYTFFLFQGVAYLFMRHLWPGWNTCEVPALEEDTTRVVL